MSAAQPLPAPVDPSTMDHFVHLHVDWHGSWTLNDEEADRGVEPDECYTVRRVAKGDEDRPDVAIEVVWTSGGINKLEVYRKLGVREVWFS